MRTGTRCRHCSHKSSEHTTRGGCTHSIGTVCGCTWAGNPPTRPYFEVARQIEDALTLFKERRW